MVASQLHFMLYEGLLRLNPDMTIAPAAAKSWEISEDGKTYTFYLDDTKWSDGAPVTAHDFEFSWKSILDPQFPSPDAYLLYSVKNAKLAKKGNVPLDQVGIYTRGEKTLVVELEYPAPYFLQIVASSVLLPVRKGSEESCHNGPFKLKSRKFNQEIVLEKNPRYRKAADVKLKSICIEIIDREMAALHMYASGHFDLIGAPLSFFPAALLQDLEQKKLLSFFPVAATKFLSFNTTVFPFSNANIRRAFSMAIDRKSIVENITQLNEKEALSPIPSALFSDEVKPLISDADLRGAKECFKKGLEELKVEDLGSIPFMYVLSEINHLTAQALQDQWEKVLGVKVHLEHVEFKTLHERSSKGHFSIGLFAWLADYADPMNIIERFQDRTNHRNYSKWENNDYNQLVESALKASSPEQYIEKVRLAEQFLVDEAPFTGLYHENFVFLIHPYVKGFAISPLGHIYFDRISM
jgi:oligopeptide transport system substrate-binding protein